jgi:hypothetical protein
VDGPITTTYVVECFWPGVSEADVHALDERAEAAAAALAGDAARVEYLGSILVRDDEVVLCLFEGSPEAVRLAAERAAIPFERLLEASDSTHPAGRRGRPPQPTSSRRNPGREQR